MANGDKPTAGHDMLVLFGQVLQNQMVIMETLAAVYTNHVNTSYQERLRKSIESTKVFLNKLDEDTD